MGNCEEDKDEANSKGEEWACNAAQSADVEDGRVHVCACGEGAQYAGVQRQVTRQRFARWVHLRRFLLGLV